MLDIEDWEVRLIEALPDRRESAGVAWLHDAESEVGEDSDVFDRYVLDERAARELGIQLDPLGEDEPVLG